MIKIIEKTGRNEDAAIAAALNEIGLDRDDVSVEILERAKAGFLGIGAVPAKVRVSYEVPDEPKKEESKKIVKPEAAVSAPKAPAKQEKKAPEQVERKAAAPVAAVKEKKSENDVPASSKAADDTAEFAAIRAFLNGLFERMDIEADIAISRRDSNSIDVKLSGNAMGAVIGRRGETLDAVQHLTNYVINKGNDRRMHISIDAEEYRAKREESLIHLAEKMAEKALKYKRSMALEPMNSYERHVIHTALQNYEGVTTASTGEEPNRRVVVTPVKTENGNTNAAKPRTREWA